MEIQKNPFYKLQKAKEEYEAYKLQTTSPLLLAAKFCALPFILGISMVTAGFFISLTIIGAIIGIPMMLLGTICFASIFFFYPVVALGLWFSQRQKRH